MDARPLDARENKNKPTRGKPASTQAAGKVGKRPTIVTGDQQGCKENRIVEEQHAGEDKQVPDLVAVAHKVESPGKVLLWQLQRIEGKTHHVAPKCRQQLVEEEVRLQAACHRGDVQIPSCTRCAHPLPPLDEPADGARPGVEGHCAHTGDTL